MHVHVFLAHGSHVQRIHSIAIESFLWEYAALLAVQERAELSSVEGERAHSPLVIFYLCTILGRHKVVCTRFVVLGPCHLVVCHFEAVAARRDVQAFLTRTVATNRLAKLATDQRGMVQVRGKRHSARCAYEMLRTPPSDLMKSPCWVMNCCSRNADRADNADMTAPRAGGAQFVCIRPREEGSQWQLNAGGTFLVLDESGGEERVGVRHVPAYGACHGSRQQM